VEDLVYEDGNLGPDAFRNEQLAVVLVSAVVLSLFLSLKCLSSFVATFKC